MVDLGVGRSHRPYEPTWALQRGLHAQVVEGTRRDTVLLLEHESVYTAGKRTASWDRPVDGTPVVDVDRGGKITWHGPGQVVAYPLVRLREPVDVVAYVRALESAVIAVCDRLGVTAGRVEGRSGVWVAADAPESVPSGTPPRRDRKVCAIGVRVARGVTMHGLALNCDPDLSAFGRIVPCGIDDADVTSLSAELGRDVTTTDVLPLLREELSTALAPLRSEDARTGS
ncbi:MAG: lipoyl(octanoyl) transferase LipB [Actinotalea sp.]|nr:lipoyl(octanoyl) transferase LipB [Actinotalea sp.]